MFSGGPYPAFPQRKSHGFGNRNYERINTCSFRSKDRVHATCSHPKRTPALCSYNGNAGCDACRLFGDGDTGVNRS